MGEIKPIETYYNGYRFRSRLEARWAVYFDAIHANWEYEPEGFDLGNGIYYLPDFRIYAGKNAGGRTPEIFYVEVKGVPTIEDGIKCNEFSKHHPLLIVGNIPRMHGDYVPSIYGLFNIDDDGYEVGCIRDSFNYIDGDSYPCLLCASMNGEIGLYGPDWYSDQPNPANDELTFNAYNKARQARFEHGETPQAKQTAPEINLDAQKAFREWQKQRRNK